MANFLKIIILLFLFQTFLFSNQIKKSRQVIEKTNQKLNHFQEKINDLDEKNKELFEEYRYKNKELKSTKNYNEQLKNIIDSQKKELKSLNKQILDIDRTHKNIYPLMKDMILSLKELLKQDNPFLLNERKQRVDKLEKNLDRSDIKTSEKFRILLEAFKIEYDYANTIETYQEQINNKTFNLLRIGRVGLYYQSLDLKSYAYWNNKSKKWIKIENSTAKANIKKAIRIAKKQQNVELLELPFLTFKENING